MGILRMAVGIIGNVSTMSLYSAPIITFIGVVRKKNTEEFSCIPYIMSLLGCLVYTWYATPVVSYGWENWPLVTVDVIGALLEASFITIYLWFAPVREKVKVAAITTLTILSFILIVTVSMFAFHDHHHRRLFVGCFAVVINTLMYGSPLVAVQTVIKTKSVKFMPFFLSFFTFLTSVIWMIFGLMDLDFFIATPNIIGTVLGMLQLVLYFMYMKKGIEEEPNKLDIEKNEEKIKVELQPVAKDTSTDKN